jgi:hypothetical protein
MIGSACVEGPMSDEDENAGYGPPPRRTRFKPGQSGNPRGRPKGARSTGTIVTGVLGRKVSLTAGGRQRQMPLKEAIILRMAAGLLHLPEQRRGLLRLRLSGPPFRVHAMTIRSTPSPRPRPMA